MEYELTERTPAEWRQTTYRDEAEALAAFEELQGRLAPGNVAELKLVKRISVAFGGEPPGAIP